MSFVDGMVWITVKVSTVGPVATTRIDSHALEQLRNSLSLLEDIERLCSLDENTPRLVLSAYTNSETAAVFSLAQEATNPKKSRQIGQIIGHAKRHQPD